MFNPMLASVLLGGCKGNTILEHITIYWVGATVGALGAFFIYFNKNMEKGTKNCDINNQGVIFPSIKVEHRKIQQLKTSDTADPLLIPEFKEEILEENEEATRIQEESGASVYQNEQENELIDHEIKEEFNLGE